MFERGLKTKEFKNYVIHREDVGGHRVEASELE